jgi:hypothetical protein
MRILNSRPAAAAIALGQRAAVRAGDQDRGSGPADSAGPADGGAGYT